MNLPHEIDGSNPLRAVTAPADTLNTAGADNFTAAVNDAAHETANRDRLCACDPSPFHGAQDAR